MSEVRAGVDALDEEIVALIAARTRFMEAAARIKTERAAVRDEARKAAVIAHALEVAAKAGAPAAVVRNVYEALVESSIAYEFVCFDAQAD